MTKSLAPGRLLSRFLVSIRANALLSLGFAIAGLASLAGVASASEMDLQIPHPGLADRPFWQRELAELRGGEKR